MATMTHHFYYIQEHSSNFSKFVQLNLITKRETDVVLVARGNRSVRAHRTVLGSASDYLKRLCSDSQRDETTLLFPDVHFETITAFLSLLYSGQAQMNGLEEVRNLNALLLMLDVVLPDCEGGRVSSSPTIKQEPDDDATVVVMEAPPAPPSAGQPVTENSGDVLSSLQLSGAEIASVNEAASYATDRSVLVQLLCASATTQLAADSGSTSKEPATPPVYLSSQPDGSFVPPESSRYKTQPPQQTTVVPGSSSEAASGRVGAKVAMGTGGHVAASAITAGQDQGFPQLMAGTQTLQVVQAPVVIPPAIGAKTKQSQHVRPDVCALQQQQLQQQHQQQQQQLQQQQLQQHKQQQQQLQQQQLQQQQLQQQQLQQQQLQQQFQQHKQQQQQQQQQQQYQQQPIVGQVASVPHQLGKPAKTRSATLPFLCTTCGMAYSTMKYLVRHKATKQCQAPRPADAGSFWEQKDACEAERLYSCTVCSKSFATRYGLRAHKDNHADVLQVECPVCRERFFSSSLMEIHRKSHYRLPT